MYIANGADMNFVDKAFYKQFGNAGKYNFN